MGFQVFSVDEGILRVLVAVLIENRAVVSIYGYRVGQFIRFMLIGPSTITATGRCGEGLEYGGFSRTVRPEKNVGPAVENNLSFPDTLQSNWIS